MSSRKNIQHGPTSFIKKTFKILSEDKYESIVSWSDNGDSFVIKDQHLFTNDILPLFFRHRNFSSFIRQLNMYDFHKIAEDSLEFRHQLFQRGNFGLLKEIHRKSGECSQTKESAQSLTERIMRFQSKQAKLQNTFDSLEHQYHTVVEQNKNLIEELVKSREREVVFQKALQSLEKKKSKISKHEKEGSESGDYELLNFSPLI